MKVICDRGALLEAINLVAAVVPQRTPTPQLSCVKLEARKEGGAGSLILSGTDAETSISLSIGQVDVAEPGSTAIPADKLRQIVQAEDDEPTLTLETIKDQCHIKGARGHFKVFTYPATDFPPLPDFAAAVAGSGPDAAGTVFTHESGALLDLVERTVFATARETSRYAINGVLMKRKGKDLEMVATDGRRLALARSTVKGEKAETEVSCIVPTKALAMIPRLARDPEDPVRLAISDTRIFFAFQHADDADGTPRAVLSSTLVEGSFPPYQDVLPKDQDKRIVASREELTRAVRQAAVLTNEESRGVRMTFSKADKRLKLSSRAPEMGEAEIDVNLSDYDGEDIEISFNPAFLTDVLKVVDEQNVIIELKAPNKPGLIRSSKSDFMYVVMPVNLPT